MAELAGIADKVLGMTATLVNGYAKGIFYLLFRLKARLMLLDNQAYKRPRDFCLQYGVLEEMYEEDTEQFHIEIQKEAQGAGTVPAGGLAYRVFAVFAGKRGVPGA